MYETGRFALPTNCSCFYTCNKVNQEIVPQLYHCPGSLLYSPSLNRCLPSHKNPPTQVRIYFSQMILQFKRHTLLSCEFHHFRSKTRRISMQAKGSTFHLAQNQASFGKSVNCLINIVFVLFCIQSTDFLILFDLRFQHTDRLLQILLVQC